MKVLITGADGQLGQCLQNVFLGKAQIFAFNRKTLDISNEDMVLATVKSIQPNIIINAAAYTAVDKAESEKEQAYAINALGAKSLAIAATQNKSTIIHISTDYVFDGRKKTSYSESDKTNPQSVYGQTKLDGENFVKKYCDEHIIIRTSWVFSEYGNNFVKTMLSLADTKKELNIVNDQFGGPTYAKHIAMILFIICEHIEGGEPTAFGTYHYSGKPDVSWFEFANKIFINAKKQDVLPIIPLINPIDTVNYPTPAKRPLNSKLSNDKINHAFGISPCDWQSALTNLKNFKV